MKKQRMKITSFLQISPVGIGSAYLHFKTSGYAAAFVMQINGPNFYRTYLQEEITIIKPESGSGTTKHRVVVVDLSRENLSQKF